MINFLISKADISKKKIQFVKNIFIIERKVTYFLIMSNLKT